MYTVHLQFCDVLQNWHSIQASQIESASGIILEIRVYRPFQIIT